MTTTFTASGVINNIQWPYSFVMFGTRPNDTASATWVAKGANKQFRDNSAVANNEMNGWQDASGSQSEARSTTLFQVADGQTHIAMTISASGVMKLYKNGAEVAVYDTHTTGAGTVLSDSASDLVIDLNSLSHFAFYNIELSAANITSLYNSGSGVNCYTVQGANILVSTDAQGPTITSDVADQTVMLGSTATFSVTATSSGGALSYQWQQFIGGSWTNVGTNASNYTTSPTSISDYSAQFRVQITDSNGSVTSRSASLFVIVTQMPTQFTRRGRQGGLVMGVNLTEWY